MKFSSQVSVKIETGECSGAAESNDLAVDWRN
jgi:hypothetical protein